MVSSQISTESKILMKDEVSLEVFAFSYTIPGTALGLTANIAQLYTLHFFISSVKLKAQQSSKYRDMFAYGCLSALFVLFITFLDFIFISPSGYVVLSVFIPAYYSYYRMFSSTKTIGKWWIGFALMMFFFIITLPFTPPTYHDIGNSEILIYWRTPLFKVFVFIYEILVIVYLMLSRYFNIFRGVLLSHLQTQIVMLIKILSNDLMLTIKIENQFKSIIPYICLIILCITFILFIKCLTDTIKTRQSGISLSVSTSYYYISAIYVGTMIFGDLMQLRSIPIGIFVTGVSLMTFSLIYLLILSYGISASEHEDEARFIYHRDSI